MFRRLPLWRTATAGAACAAPGSVKVSPRCARQILRVNVTQKEQQKWPATRALRLKVVPGGCQGFSYEFLFEEPHPSGSEAAAKDLVFRCDNAPTEEPIPGVAPLPPLSEAQLLVDKKSLTKLEGATVDFHSELKGSAFVVIGNEYVDLSCACGQSFSVKKHKAKLEGKQ